MVRKDSEKKYKSVVIYLKEQSYKFMEDVAEHLSINKQSLYRGLINNIIKKEKSDPGFLVNLLFHQQINSENN